MEIKAIKVFQSIKVDGKERLYIEGIPMTLEGQIIKIHADNIIYTTLANVCWFR